MQPKCTNKVPQCVYCNFQLVKPVRLLVPAVYIYQVDHVCGLQSIESSGQYLLYGELCSNRCALTAMLGYL